MVTREFYSDFMEAASDFLDHLLSFSTADAPNDAQPLCDEEKRLHAIATQAQMEGVFLPFPLLADSCEADPFEWFMLLFLYLYECLPDVSALYHDAAGIGSAVTLERLRALYALLDPHAFRARHITLSPSIRPLLLPVDDSSPMVRRPLRLHPRVIAYLLNGIHLSTEETPFNEIYFPFADSLRDEDSFADDTVLPVATALDNESESQEWLLLMQAPRMASHSRYLNRLADHLGLACIHVDMSRFDLTGDGFPLSLQDALVLECAMYRPIVALHNADRLLFPEQAGGGASPALYVLLRRLQESARIIVLCAEREWRPDRSLSRFFLSFPIVSAPLARRAALWAEKLGKNAENIDIDALAIRFDLDPIQIEDALTKARLQASMAAQPLDSRTLFTACYHQIATNLHEYARLIQPRYEWDDLILAESTKSILQDTCLHMELRDKVLRQWDFKRMLPYGQSVSMVFMGPPGTGKTMASQVMAHQLGYEIYRVDVSQMVSKYVGETEKNLDKIFEEASKVGVILFFDEADALFAKRTEVKDSLDRHSNMETGFLLQRVEDYDGMIILATNHVANMDDAFLRRMRFVVRFNLPDRACRLRMWRGMLPDALPKDFIDYEFLAQQFELSGSDIKNILLHAAFHAAQDDGPLSMEHIVKAMRYHHEKINKTFLQSMLGPYSNLLSR